jgi:hypothetical protein
MDEGQGGLSGLSPSDQMVLGTVMWGAGLCEQWPRAIKI